MPKKILLFIALAALVSSFFYADLQQYLSFEYIKENQHALQSFYSERPLTIALGFFCIYVVVTALSLPGATILTLLGGAVFGLWHGMLIVSFASSIGATLAFLTSRTLLRNAIQNRFEKQLSTINTGIAKEGALYLFTLRLAPAVPFFVVNLAMGLTPLKTWTFYWVSQIGMLAGTLIYVNAGTQIAQLESLKEVVSPSLLLSLGLLGIFPLLAKNISKILKTRRLYAQYKKPKNFDTNLIVIGAGAAGLVSSYIASAVKAKVSLIEKNLMGGDCLNSGCVPSKALIRSTRFIHDAKHSDKLGIKSLEIEFDFKDIMARVKRVIKEIEPHDSIERYTGLGVDCISGHAEILSPYEVQVGEQRITARNMIIATGAGPYLPGIENISSVDALTSDTIWNLKERPKHLLVLGGGPIACELSQCFQRLGSKVTIVIRGARLLSREDEKVSDEIEKSLLAEGVTILRSHAIEKFEINDECKKLVCIHQGKKSTIEFDEVLVAMGRKARLEGFGLEKLGITEAEDKTLQVNEYLQTRVPNIYACGDVIGSPQFTHVAAHEAWYACVNALFGRFKKFRSDYSVIPAVTFTQPEVARVGLNEIEANEQKIEYEVTEFSLSDLDRAIADENTSGFVKVLTPPGKDKILGATIVGEHAGELLSEFTLAMKYKLGLNNILATTHAYPTLAEANKYVAGEWKKAHTSKPVLMWLEKYHSWFR